MYRVRLNTAKSPAQFGLCLPARVLEGLGVTPGAYVEVQVGRKLARERIGVGARSCISLQLKQKLRLPPGVLRLHVARRGDRLEIGPFLGILARPQKSSPYGEQTGFFRRLIARAKAMHMYAYVFGPNDFDAKAGTVMGHRPYKTTTTWVMRRCPVPDVVFDRGFFHGAEKTRVNKMRDVMARDFGVRIFNNDLGTKWDVHQVLVAEPALAEHMPETAQLSGPAIIGEFIDRHRVVYIKPSRGTQGRNIFRVRNRTNRLAYEAHLRGGRTVRSSVRGPAELVERLKATKERHPFLVQQGLALTRVQGRTSDLRALVQRDRTGTWQFTGVGVRIGGRTNVVSNLHAGGSAAKIDVLVPRPGRRAKAAELEARVKELVLRIAETLGHQCLLGELGVDLGLDTEGRLWVIEVNLRPGRATFRRAGLTEAWRRSGRAPLEFALYLWDRRGNEDGIH